MNRTPFMQICYFVWPRIRDYLLPTNNTILLLLIGWHTLHRTESQFPYSFRHHLWRRWKISWLRLSLQGIQHRVGKWTKAEKRGKCRLRLRFQCFTRKQFKPLCPQMPLQLMDGKIHNQIRVNLLICNGRWMVDKGGPELIAQRTWCPSRAPSLTASRRGLYPKGKIIF